MEYVFFFLVAYVATDAIKDHIDRLDTYRTEVIRAFEWRNRGQYCIDRKKNLFETSWERRKFLKIIFVYFFTITSKMFWAVRKKGKLIYWRIQYKGFNPADGTPFPETSKHKNWKPDITAVVDIFDDVDPEYFDWILFVYFIFFCRNFSN